VSRYISDVRRSALSVHEYRALADLRFELRKFLAFSEEQARVVGIEPRQHQLLLAVKGLPEGQAATVGALAERLVLRHHSTVELLDRLQRRKLVRRVAIAEDRRQMRVEILPAGEALLSRLSLAHREELRRRGPGLAAALARAVEAR
jgi:DNA-binding MarR family transcriptional regulator